ncbi:MAG TPA: methyltransferase domain-containing protein [Rhizomicrobium sp.]|nr:methyltransferase domain-containing protein [Rhizomicrobium sp.]
MAAQIPHGPVLELGPGTGVITEAVLARGTAPGALTLIEYDPHFANLLRTRFPGVTVIRGDAFDLARTLGQAQSFAAVVSGLPLLNFPREARASLLQQIFARLQPGAPFVQFSYGVKPPVPAPEGASVTRAAFIAFNIPPARVWVYRKTESTKYPEA